MIISRALENALYCVFNNHVYNISSSGEISLTVPIENDKLVIPIIANSSITQLIYNSNTHINNNIICNLSKVQSQFIKKTADTIIHTLFGVYDSTCNLYCVDSTKGYKYYGSQGLILDDNYSPLLIMGHMAKITNRIYDYDTQYTPYIYLNPICLVSPRVFNNEDIVSKTISKKVIPYVSSVNFQPFRDRGSIKCINNRCKVIISSEIDDYIHKVVPPMDINANDSIYNLLESAKEEIRR